MPLETTVIPSKDKGSSDQRTSHQALDLKGSISDILTHGTCEPYFPSVASLGCMVGRLAHMSPGSSRRLWDVHLHAEPDTKGSRTYQ